MAKETKALQELLDTLWTTQDLERVFRKTPMTIHTWRRDRGLPAVVIPGSVRAAVRYVPNDVFNWARATDTPIFRLTAVAA